MADTRDPSPDGLRGVAGLWVFGTHATYADLLPPPLNLRGAGRGGGVLFFFLSAFLPSGLFKFSSCSRRSRRWPWPSFCTG